MSNIAPSDYHLNIGGARDLKIPQERFIYRIFEILPAALSWGSLVLAVILSWLEPFWFAIFIICFSLFWLLRTVYFAFHLWAGYKKMTINESVDWIKRDKNLVIRNRFLPAVKSWRDIYHLIVVPMYKEPLEVVRDNFLALEKSDYPKDKMIVALACEGKNKDFAGRVAKEIEREFGKKFFRFLVTWHPADLPGEIAGKGSNETWSVKKARELIIDPLKIPYENITFSSFDADTCVFPKYFSCLAYYYLTAQNPTRTSFQPVPLFINNIWQAPVISRIFSFSSTFWHTINQERPEKLITFSSHSMSFKVLVDVGFKQTNVVSDDSRIFWQCFFKYDGDYRVMPIYYPVSMDANVSKSFSKTMVNVYKQQRRWAYGVADIPYFLFGALKNKKIPFKKELSLGFELIEGHFSWASVSVLIFVMGWLPLIFGGIEFSQTIISYSLPKIIGRLMTLSMAGLILSIYLSFLLLPPKPLQYGRSKYLVFAFSWLLFPFMMMIFTSLPAFDAQTRLMLGRYMGFWPTEKVRKQL